MTPTIIIEPIDESLKPGKFHFEITHQLYQHGFDIDEDILNQFLNLDRDQVIEDLENVIKGSIYNAENYLDEWTVDNSCFVIHSISLLGELEATQSLPLVLKTLKQDVEYHEFHWHLIASEILWIPILKLAKDQLPVLVDHMKTPGLYTLNKTPILSVLEQIYYHFPEKKDAILDVFEQLFQFYSNEEFENNILDTDLNGFLTWHVLDMGEKRLLPMIEKLYSKNYVNESVCGDLEYVKEEFSKSKRLMFENKSSIISIKERYIELLNETSEIYDDELDDNIDDKIDHELNDKILNDIVGLTENKNSNLIPSSETIINEKKVGRNALCPCGSGKKYKKCCLD